MNWWWIGGIAFLVGLFYIFAPLVICRFTLRRYNPDGLPALQEIIRRFEWRASSRQCGSHAILVLILGLLAAAAWVFAEAKAITTRETSGDLSQRLSQEIAKNDADISDQNRLRSLLTAAVKRAVDLIGREASGPMRGGISIQFIDSSGKIKDAQSLAQEIKNNPNFQFNPEPSGTSPNVSLQVMGHRTNSLSGLLESYQILQFDRRLTQDDLDKLASGKSLWEPEDLSSLLSQYDKKYHDIEIDLGALSRIAVEKRIAEVAKEAGEEPTTEVSGNLTLPFLLQLNITRFGTITLASIAIGILVPLYRFSERLSAFYRARADALRLHQTAGYKTVGIIPLSTMLTPTIDYGKSQNIPDHLVEMLRLAGRTEEDK